MTGKIFCIGFHKTGTTSIAAALEHLGYRVTGPNGVADPDIASNVYDMAHQLVPEYDAFQDNPWPILFKEMDHAYPGSKFILTRREPNKWIASQVEHFGQFHSPMREWIYGVGYPQGNEQTYIQRYQAHNQEVIEYFRDRPEDLLVLDVDEGELTWERLCPFLGAEIPRTKFPVRNKARRRKRRRAINAISRLASRLGGRRRRL